MIESHRVSIIVSWRDRHELRSALPNLSALAECASGEIIVVNFGGSALLLEAQLQGFKTKVQVVTVEESRYFNKAAAQNIGAANSRFSVLFFCDCDIMVDPVSLWGTIAKVASEPHTFATLAGVRETNCNSRKAKHIVSFGYTLQLRTADGRNLSIIDNEEDANTGTRQAPGLLIVKREDFLRIGGYNARLHGWGWEDQDMISRLTLGLGLKRISEGDALHLSHDDNARLKDYPAVASRWESRDRMFRAALANYDRADFNGTFTSDCVNRRIFQRPGLQGELVHSASVVGAQPSLSVCMIARDEEAVLGRCLASLKGIAREICVVDTGSKDGTPEVALSYGAKLVRFTECNSADGRIIDFSAPRNVALKLATQEWILQIDADEVMSAGHEHLSSVLENSAFDRIGVCINDKGTTWISGRIFKKCVAGEYRGRIHEYLECSGTFGVQSQIVIDNLEDKEGKEPASERNIRLCLLSLEENPEDARLHHYLGNEYRALRQWAKAAECYHEAIRLEGFQIGLFHSHYYLGVCYLLQGSLDRAIETALAAIKCDPRYAEGHCLLADTYSCAGQFSFAKIWYRSALSCGAPPPDAVLPIQEWAYCDHPKKRLSMIDEADCDFSPQAM
jgi:glycosyltransferase involved in cell wall biosynthesis